MRSRADAFAGDLLATPFSHIFATARQDNDGYNRCFFYSECWFKVNGVKLRFRLESLLLFAT